MNNTSEKKNYFKIRLMQENVLLYERAFDADQFNPFTRYSVDIRGLLRDIISGLQKQMSRKKLITHTQHTEDNYELLELAEFIEVNGEMVNSYRPKVRTQYIEDVDITLKGVMCKIGLYINENPIVERDFYVDNFNPECRWSVDLTSNMDGVSYAIEQQIKNVDVENTWDDHDMIHLLGYDFVQIMEFTPEMRMNALRKLAQRRKY